MNYQLVCTFTTQYYIAKTLQFVLSTFIIPTKKIFIFEDTKNNNNIFYTYNISETKKSIDSISDTILIHRKKETNTLYTINALNEVVRKMNNGILDETFEINWENYEDTMILATDSIIRVIKLKLKEIFYVKN